MAGINNVAINQALTFLPDGSTQHSYAYFPDNLNGKDVEFAIYVLFGHGTSAGKIQLQTAPTIGYSGVWSNIGNTIDWAVQDSTKHVFLTGCPGALRLDIDTAISGGTVTAWVIACAA